MKVISLRARIRENVHAITIWLSLYNYYFMRNLNATGSLFCHFNIFLFHAYKYISDNRGKQFEFRWHRKLVSNSFLHSP